MANPRLSVVIPAYNEAAGIRRTVEEVGRFLTGEAVSHEILVVDDGSSDQTVPLVRALAVTQPAVRILQSSHLGKGEAVKRGILEATGDTILFMDADHSTRIEEWRKFAPWFAQGFDVVIGSRKMPGADIRVRQPWLRETMGRVFTWLTNALLGTRVSDITCGFKALQAPAAKRLFRLVRIPGWGFDAELLFLVRRLGYRLKEVPVVWTNDATTKVRLGSDALRSSQELLAIRWRAWRGGYAAQPEDQAPSTTMLTVVG